jgi:iron complex transport system substrate-binding protein
VPKYLTLYCSLVVCTILLVLSAGCGSASNAPAVVTVASSGSTPLATQDVGNERPQAILAGTPEPSGIILAPNQQIIVDMFGRKLVVAKPVNRVLCTGPVEATMVYLIAPDKLAGLVAKYDGDPPLVPEKYADLPVVGGWYGAMVGNYETFMTYKPDIILEGKLENLPDRQVKFGSIPVVGDDTGADLLLHFEKCFTFLGKILDADRQAVDLNVFYRDAMQYVNSVVSRIPQNQRVRVYYCEGLEGLNTDPVSSFHNNLIAFCGGVNVAENIPMLPGAGMSQVSMENILAWDPDIIIMGRATPVGLYRTILESPECGQLSAVKNRQVFVRPDNPFSIFDGPPGPAQILGMYWMVHTLYPEQTKDLDLNSKFKEFYGKFFHYDLTDDEVVYLLENPQ